MPVIQNIDPDNRSLQAVILCPTRRLPSRRQMKCIVLPNICMVKDPAHLRRPGYQQTD
ncbi:MAG: hypothetical protein ACLUOI_24260 [Eisenbergiella sp.]